MYHPPIFRRGNQVVMGDVRLLAPYSNLVELRCENVRCWAEVGDGGLMDSGVIQE